MPDKLTAFTWGYWGWGTATRELAWAFGAVEESRGCGAPLFVDARVSRSVRAIGFRDRAFEELVGNRRYRWMPGLGNEAVATGRGAMRLRRPEDVEVLLDLILEHEPLHRRVVFFCSCESPWNAAECHRTLVADTLLAAARARKVKLSLEEWPGGEILAEEAPSIRVPPGTLKALASGGKWVTLSGRPDAELLGIPTGSLVSLEEGSGSRMASVCPPRFVAGRWKVQLFVEDAPGQSRRDLLREAHRKRAGLLLDARRT